MLKSIAHKIVKLVTKATWVIPLSVVALNGFMCLMAEIHIYTYSDMGIEGVEMLAAVRSQSPWPNFDNVSVAVFLGGLIYILARQFKKHEALAINIISIRRKSRQLNIQYGYKLGKASKQ